MTSQLEKHSFQAETQQLLDLMIHSLYTHEEVFLRELISNASDALDKLRFAALTEPALRQDAGEPRILLVPDKDARTLVVEDNGIGMTRDEVVADIGTIARSGTKGFLEELRRVRARAEEQGGERASLDAPELIGQFGVGFYSAFMVAERVVLETRKAGSTEAVRWTSTGDGEYTLEPIEKDAPGTRITLHLRPRDPADESFHDFTDPHVLADVVRRYSDFVAHPIELQEEDGEEHDGERPRTRVLNSRQPLWTRPRGEVGDDEHHQFYSHLTGDPEAPFATLHLRAEGGHEYTALLYLPARRPPELFDPSRPRCRVSLYVKRVFVMDDCEELLPPWLRFVRGVVDSADLPLNVSRETLQHSRPIKAMRRHLVRKILELLAERLREDRSAYEAFWQQLGSVLKEGLYLDDEHRDALAALCLWESSATGPTGTVARAAAAGPAREEEKKEGDGAPRPPADSPFTTLGEYVERMPFAQKALFYVLGPDRASAEGSPHIEGLLAKGHEVLFFVDPVDEWAAQRLRTFEGRPLAPVDRGESSLGDEASRAKKKEREEELSDLLEAARESLDDYVKEVRLSERLKDSPAVLVHDEGAISPQLAAALRAAGQPVPTPKRILELNPEHPLLARLTELHRASRGEDEAAKAAEQDFHLHLELLHGQALLAEGSPVADPPRFARLIARLLAAPKG